MVSKRKSPRPVGAVTHRDGEWSVNLGAGGSWEFDRIEDAHALSAAVEKMLEDERKTTGVVLTSLAATFVTLPEDFASDHRKAWLFGVLCGWCDAALDHVAQLHRWGAPTVSRLVRYRSLVSALQEAAKPRG
jgi:hypothetical protein